MSLFAFVIPVLDEESVIADTLRDLRRRYPDCELIVVDGGSSDSTVVNAMPLCDTLLTGRSGRAAQMNLGGRAGTAQYLCFLHADSRPGATAQQLASCFAREPQWGFCRVRLSGRGLAFRIIERTMNLRSRLTGIGTGDQMLFLRRELFESSGGFDEIPLMEDVAYCKRLRRVASPKIMEQPVLTSSRRWEVRGVYRTVAHMWVLRLAYFLGVSPARLWRSYYG